MSDADCEGANGTFYFPAQSKEECLRDSLCWTPAFIETGLLVPPDPTTGLCPKNGNLQTIFQWEDAKWIEGTWASSVWVRRQAVRANVIRKTINFPLLQGNVSFPSAISLKTSLQNEVWCPLSKYLASLFILDLFQYLPFSIALY